MTEEQLYLFQMMQHRLAARLTVIMGILEKIENSPISSFRYSLVWKKQDEEAVESWVKSRACKND